MREKRSHDRFPIELELTLVYEGELYPGRTKDVSLGGMFVHTAATLRFGAELDVRLELPKLRYRGVLPATVRWHKAEGIGLSFRSLGPQDVRAFNQLMGLR